MTVAIFLGSVLNDEPVVDPRVFFTVPDHEKERARPVRDGAAVEGAVAVA